MKKLTNIWLICNIIQDNAMLKLSWEFGESNEIPIDYHDNELIWH